ALDVAGRIRPAHRGQLDVGARALLARQFVVLLLLALPVRRARPETRAPRRKRRSTEDIYLRIREVGGALLLVHRTAVEMISGRQERAGSDDRTRLCAKRADSPGFAIVGEAGSDVDVAERRLRRGR